MPIDPLTAQLLTGGGGNDAAMLGALDPTLAAVTPEMQLGQQMIQQGTSAAPAYPLQALARALQAPIGAYLQKGAISDLGKAYSQSLPALQNLFPAGTPHGDAFRSGNPMLIQMAMRSVPDALKIAQHQTEPMTEVGKAWHDAMLMANQGYPQALEALQRANTRAITGDSGVNPPETQLLGPGPGPRPSAPPPPAPTGPPRIAPNVTPTVAVPPPQAQSSQPTPADMTAAKAKLAQNLTGQINPHATGIESYSDLLAAANANKVKTEADAKAQSAYPSLYNPPQGKGPGLTEPTQVPSPSGSIGSNINVPPVSAQAKLPDPGEMPGAQKTWEDTKKEWSGRLGAGDAALQKLSTIEGTLKSIQSGTFTSQRASIAAALKTAGMDGLAATVLNGDPADVQLAAHENIIATLSTLKEAVKGGRFAQTEFKITSVNKENPDLMPAANQQMLVEDMAQIRQSLDVPNTWAQASRNWHDPNSYEAEFYKSNPLSDYVAREQRRMGPLKGMPGAAQSAGQTGVPAIAAPKSPFTPAQIQAEMKRRGLM